MSGEILLTRIFVITLDSREGFEVILIILDIFFTIARKPSNIKPSAKSLGRLWAGNGPIGPKAA